MKVKIITGRPASGKTSYALGSLATKNNMKILYISFEGISRFHKEKFQSLFLNKDIQFVEALPTNFRDEFYDLIVLDYVEISKVGIDEFKDRASELWILSQLRKDGSYHECLNAELEIIKSKNFETKIKSGGRCQYFFETENKMQLLLKSRKPIFPFDADDVFSCWLYRNPIMRKYFEEEVWGRRGRIFAMLPNETKMILAEVDQDEVMNGRRFTIEALGATQFSYEVGLKCQWGWSVLDRIKREIIRYFF